MGSRYLKVFDIRGNTDSIHVASYYHCFISEEHHSVLQTSSQREFAQHKAIYGISVDPNNVYQLASYAEVKEEGEREREREGGREGGESGRGREGRVVEGGRGEGGRGEW